jgi:hypothetical protein
MKTHETAEWEQVLFARLNRLAGRLYRTAPPGDGVWSQPFRGELQEIGHGLKPKCEVWGTGLRDWTEWLLDVCWGRYSGSSFRGLAMACEIEWKPNPTEWLHDFHKLTVCKADLRLFVFGCRLKFDPKTDFEVLVDASRYDPGSRYLAIAVPVRGPCDCYQKAWTS